MRTIIFDFDSTIISCESLEMILGASPEIQAITEKGLRGEITFEESLNQRLAISSPTRGQVEAFGKQAHQYLTYGMESLIQKLIDHGNDLWIFSGGLKESVLPLGIELGIPRKQIQAVEVLWNADGSFASLIPPYEKHFFPRNHKRPAVAVGDAMSDYRLYETGVVDDFILYTEHFYCDEIVAKGVKKARNVHELEALLNEKR